MFILRTGGSRGLLCRLLFLAFPGHHPAKKARDSKLFQEPPVFRLGLGGHADPVVEAGMGIPARDGDSAQRAHKRADRGPGAGFPLGLQAIFDGGEKEVGQDRDEEMPHAAGGLVVEDRADPQVALEIPEDALHLGQRGVEGPDVGASHVCVAGFDDVCSSRGGAQIFPPCRGPEKVGPLWTSGGF